jgi:hypothetical protein
MHQQHAANTGRCQIRPTDALSHCELTGSAHAPARFWSGPSARLRLQPAPESTIERQLASHSGARTSAIRVVGLISHSRNSVWPVFTAYALPGDARHRARVRPRRPRASLSRPVTLAVDPARKVG